MSELEKRGPGRPPSDKTDLEKRREAGRRTYRRRRRLFLERAAIRRASMTPEQKARMAAHQAAWKAAHPSYHAEYLKKYRETAKGRAVFRGANLRARQKKRVLINQQKKSPCTDCGGGFHPEAMEFDHRETDQKTFDIATYGKTVATNTLLIEMAKCDLVCANCHRVRTARRRAGLPATLPPPDYEI